ncbi:MAG TPA: RNase adapter RapZ [Acidimicrobiales bacterium]|nr:RNase adapter RapZ [Acidimicrobiales bacterium]
MGEFLIITGLSGAGRSQAGATLEDLGWYVMDNIPTPLITRVPDLAERDRVALVVGRDVEQLAGLEPAVAELRRRGLDVRILFLDATDEVLVRRFEGTRRRHPAGREGLLEAVALERQRLAPIRLAADVVIDTSELNVHQLRRRLIELFVDGGQEPMRISVVSFGYKFGLPLDVDTVFDVRFLPNPHWVPALSDLPGLDPKVREFVLGRPETSEFVERVDDLLGFLLPSYAQEGKSYMTIGVGCTGGRHRSVVVAEEIAERIRKRDYPAAVFHRDVDR